MNFKNRLASFSVRAAIVLAPFLGGCGSIQATYWDARIDELCRKDGGVTVYEHVKISAEEYKRLGGTGGSVPVPTRRVASPSALYIAEETTTWLSRDPDVFRTETLIVRAHDKKVLSRLVNYGRVRHELGRGHGCQDAGIELDVERQTFEIKEG